MLRFMGVALLAAGCSGGGGMIDAGDDLSVALDMSVPVGCPRDFPDQCPSTPPSYMAQVAPLISAYCAPCHSPGSQAGDKPLETYMEVFNLRTTAEDELYNCIMPPPDAGTPQPTETDRLTILTWFACNAPNN